MMIDSQEEDSRPKSLKALTSLRFFAAAVIVIHHSKGSFGLDFPWLMHSETSQPVSFFFVLSGFILAYVYSSLESKQAVCRFLIARIARVWPLHAATFLLVLVLIPANLRTLDGLDTASLVLTNVFMVQSWIPIWNYYFSYNWLSWAISTEFAFYLLFPLLLYAWQRTWRIKLFCAFLLVVMIITFANVTHLPSGEAKGTTDQVGYVGLLYIGPLGRLFEFVLGMSLASAFPRMTPCFNPGKTVGTIIELVALAMPAVVMASSFEIFHWISLHLPWIGASGNKWMLRSGLPCTFYGLLILLMAMEKGMISRFLSCGFLCVLGEMSLSIFLLHQILVRYYQWRIEDITDLPDWFLFGYLWVVLLLGAYVLMVLIERPCRRFILGIGQSDQKTGSARLDEVVNSFHGASTRKIIGNAGFAWLVGKTHILYAGCALLIISFAVPLYLNGAITPKNAIEPAAAFKIIDQWDPENRQIQFGNKFILLGASISKMTDRVRLQLVWESMNNQQLKYRVAVHVLDNERHILLKADYSQNRGHILVRDQVIWLEKTEINLESFPGAATLGIVLYATENTEVLLPDRGNRDWNNQRLLIQLPGQP